MSSASSEQSEASPGSEDTTCPPPPSSKELPSQSRPHVLQTSRNVLLFLVAFRILNALCVKTFFQPDEFFQSLEPAWQIVFGKDSGAWITWEWRHHLRSSIHPYLFAGVYYISSLIARASSLSPLGHADLLVVAPKAAQAFSAALGDYYTWKLAGDVYGADSLEASATLMLTVVSPWQWFCSTRTLSNCLETTLTIVAIYLWPWHWSLKPVADAGTQASGSPKNRNDLLRLRVCLVFAALACVLRPTNLMVWVCLVSFVVVRNPPRIGQHSNEQGSASTADEYTVLLREALLCGSAVFGLSILADRVYFEEWTFPPLKFLYFNLAQSLAVFYGKNDWHYYLSQGYPLLLTTALPFTLIGLYQTLNRWASDSTNWQRGSMSQQLAAVCVFMPSVLSLISHKEVRFIYPLLPCLHVLAAPPLVRAFSPGVLSGSWAHTPRRLTLGFVLLVNAVVAYYVSVSHASGTINVLSYLREQHNGLPAKAGHNQSFSRPLSKASLPRAPVTMTVGFLMPCHSTPWRSHLVFPTINAWALTCEPPINFNDTQKATYRDEADQFYDDPPSFLHTHMVGGTRHLPGRPSYQTHSPPGTNTISPSTDSEAIDHPDQTRHEWPDYLIFFSQLEPLLKNELRTSAYAECYRTWNTAWHDDWRRKGDIIVWCLDGDSQREWQEQLHQQQQQRRRWRQWQSWKSIFSVKGSSSSRTQSAQQRKREKHFDKIVKEIKKEAGGQRWPSWWPSYQWARTPFSSYSFSLPWGDRRKTTIPRPWADVNSYFQRLSSPSSWSELFSRERGNKGSWRNWVGFLKEYLPKEESSAAASGGSSDDDHGRNLWS